MKKMCSFILSKFEVSTKNMQKKYGLGLVSNPQNLVSHIFQVSSVTSKDQKVNYSTRETILVLRENEYLPPSLILTKCLAD